MRWKRGFLAVQVLVFMLAGCAKKQSRVICLTEQQIIERERVVDNARHQFSLGNYEKAIELTKPFCSEMTTSSPLYQCELGTYHLANEDKERANELLLNAYNSIECFFDSSTEKKAVSLWGAESDKVFKGEPYEQATLSMLVGLLFLENGDADNALACFKNGQFADCGSKEEQYQSDYGLLQLLEAKCYQLRGDLQDYQQLKERAIDSFLLNHPSYIARQAEMLMEVVRADADKAISKEEREAIRVAASRELKEVEAIIENQSATYYSPLLGQYNTLVLVWSGKSPKMVRTGKHQNHRIVLKVKNPNYHYEMQLDNDQWHDVIRGFSDITYQAVTRGDRLMDKVLSGQASFKKGTVNFGDSMFDLANNSPAELQLAFAAVGLIAYGVGGSVDAQADTRWWKTLPDEIGVVPLTLTPGEHTFAIDCYDNNLKKRMRVNKKIFSRGKPFEFHVVAIPQKSSSGSSEVYVAQKKQ
jgi:tetratricopeptide (TPR) repeat protein